MTSSSRPSGAGAAPLRVAYVMSRFPKLTETFIVNEIAAVERTGVQVEIYPLLREKEELVHPLAAEQAQRAHYLPFISRGVLASNLYFLLTRPRAYLGALATAAKGTFGSRQFFLGALVFFPKVAHAARMMASTGVQHVHCHFATHPALAGLVIRRLVGIPYSFTAHGSDVHVDRRMICQKAAEAAFVVAISQSNRSVLQAECGSAVGDKIRVVHCGVDTGLFRGSVDNRRVSAAAPLRILSIGTLHEVKGQRYLLDACALLRARDIAFTCRLVGDGPDRSLLERLIAQHQLAEHVSLLGPRRQDEVLAELDAADVLVAPSVPASDGRREGIPVVLMEAMSFGLPVVSTRLSGIPELVADGRSGLLVPPRDASALAAVLGQLAADRHLRERLGSEARRTIEREFDVLANATRLGQLFGSAA